MLVYAMELYVALMVLAQDEDTVVVTIAEYQGNVAVILVHFKFRSGRKVPISENEKWGAVVYNAGNDAGDPIAVAEF
jgi:hypothetical protein